MLSCSYHETAFSDHNNERFKNSVPALIRAFRLRDASYLLHRQLIIFRPQPPWIIYAKSILDEGDRVHVFSVMMKEHEKGKLFVSTMVCAGFPHSDEF